MKDLFGSGAYIYRVQLQRFLLVACNYFKLCFLEKVTIEFPGLGNTSIKLGIKVMQRLFTAGTLVEAYLVQQLLESNSIRSMVFNENAQGAVGELPITEVWPEVWIEDLNFIKAAKAIIRGYENNQMTQPSHLCSSCAEQNPGNFELCWSCGATFENRAS